MQLQQTYDALNKFAKEVIKQSRANLTRGKKNYKKNLYKSLDSELSVGPNSFSLSFIMEEYGMYQDQGVSGVEKKYKTPYSYKTKMPPVKPLADWAKFRRIRLRDEKGRFSKGDYNTIGFLIARKIFKEGIKPSLFFTKPFERNFERLPDELVDRFALDLDDLFDFTT